MSAVKLDILAHLELLRRDALAVPAHKPGFFASAFGTPWGSTEDALKLIRGGRVAEGRTLLRKIFDFSKDGSVGMRLAWDLMLKPDEPKQALELLNRLPQSCEWFSIICGGLLSRFDAANYEKAIELLEEARRRSPAATSGWWYYLYCEVCSSHLQFLAYVLKPRKMELTTYSITAIMKGAANFALRQYPEAWNSFERASASADDSVLAFEKTLKINLSDEEKGFLGRGFRTFGAIGQAIVLWELGREGLGIILLTEAEYGGLISDPLRNAISHLVAETVGGDPATALKITRRVPL